MTARLLIPALIFAGGAAAGAVARGAVGPDAPEPPSAPAPLPTASALLDDVRQLPPGKDDQSRQLIGMLESLSLALTQEAEYRLVLEEQIDTLSTRLDMLQARVEQPGTDRTLDERFKARLAARAERRGPLTVERLTDAGLDESTARSLKSKVDDIAMQRLYLRDQAQREGWLGDSRYRDEVRRLGQAQAGLQNEFGSEVYDAYLYASGRPNRIEVQNVLDNSPAFEAGLRTGDQILSYNGQRTFQTNELRQATQQGRSGEMIPVQIIRNGQPMDIYVPRGPLGIQMTGRSVNPDGT